MLIALFGKNIRENFYEHLLKIFIKLQNNKIDIIIYKPFYDFLRKKYASAIPLIKTYEIHTEIRGADYMLTIGGDGTFLDAVSFVRDKGIPIVGINSGRLGFLADISENIEGAIDSVISKNYTIDERSLIHLNTDANIFSSFSYALNEFSIQKKDNPSLIKIHTYIDDAFLNTYWADGLIISTPTGSTAYSMSAGGPIVMPSSHNFIISPLASHNLTVRPIVVPDDKTIRLHIEGREKNYLAALDSRFATVTASVEITLKKADFKIKMLKLPNYNFYKTIRKKLMWGADIRN